MHTNNIETVEQILSELTLLYQLLKVLVSRSDNSYIHLHRCMTTDAVELTVCQYAQQARLSLGRHIADFIKKERTAIRLLEAATTSCLCAGKGTLLMSK